jgi:hypothetical protein
VDCIKMWLFNWEQTRPNSTLIARVLPVPTGSRHNRDPHMIPFDTAFEWISGFINRWRRRIYPREGSMWG